MKEEFGLQRYREYTEEIKALLVDWIDSGLTLFLKLREFERSGYWKAGPHATFSDYLREEFRCAPIGFERYTNVVKAIDLYGEDFVRKIGVHSCHAISVEAMASSPERIEALKGSVEAHIQLHGSAPDPNTVRDIRNGIAKELVRRHSTTRQLDELIELREMLRVANARIRALEKENGELKKKVSKK